LRSLPVIAASAGLVLFRGGGEIAALYGKPGLTWPLRGVALALVGSSLLQLYGAALIAQARLPVGFLMTLAQSAGFLVFGVVLVSLGAGATGAAFGRAIGYGFGLAVGTVMIVRLFGRSALAIRPGRGHQRQNT